MASLLTFMGLLLITVGSIAAALCSPSPRYNSDGSVSLSGEPDKQKRIAMHRRQKYFPRSLVLIGIGALCQAIALFVC